MRILKKMVFEMLKRYYLFLLNVLGEVVIALGIFRIFLSMHSRSFAILYHLPSRKILLSHILFFKRFFTIVDSDSLLKRKGKHRHSSNLCITFDDGYRYIYDALYDVFQSEHVPFSIFLSTQNIESGEPFWWDIYEVMKKLSDNKVRGLINMRSEERSKVLMLTDTIKDHKYLRNRSPLSWKEIQTMLDSGLLTVGDHGYSHTSLTLLSEKEINAELKKSRGIIKDHLGIEVKTFAYPNGDFSFTCERILRQLGYRAAFTTLPGANSPFENPFFFKRIEADEARRGILALKIMGLYSLLTGFRLERYLMKRGVPVKQLRLKEERPK